MAHHADLVRWSHGDTAKNGRQAVNEQTGAVAQLGERRLCKAEVRSSSLLGSTKINQHRTCLRHRTALYYAYRGEGRLNMQDPNAIE
jgi:hypothetical protein